MDMIWKVVDLYREAVLLTREVDMESEAIASFRECAGLGGEDEREGKRVSQKIGTISHVTSPKNV